jgi:HEPN domain-containing protein
MRARNQIDQAIKIKLPESAPFPQDLIVRTPQNVRWRLREGDWLLREIVSQGKVLYKKLAAAWVRKAEDDFQAARRLARGERPLHDQLWFHCQQSAEKYLKAMLQVIGLPVPGTRDVNALLTSLPTPKLKRGAVFLTQSQMAYPNGRYRGRLTVVHTSISRIGNRHGHSMPHLQIKVDKRGGPVWDMHRLCLAAGSTAPPSESIHPARQPGVFPEDSTSH